MDFNARAKNMVFTTSGKYDIGVSVSGMDAHTTLEEVFVGDIEAWQSAGLSREEAESVVLFSSAHEGTHVTRTSKEADLRAEITEAYYRGYIPNEYNTFFTSYRQ